MPELFMNPKQLSRQFSRVCRQLLQLLQGGFDRGHCDSFCLVLVSYGKRWCHRRGASTTDICENQHEFRARLEVLTEVTHPLVPRVVLLFWVFPDNV